MFLLFFVFVRERGAVSGSVENETFFFRRVWKMKPALAAKLAGKSTAL